MDSLLAQLVESLRAKHVDALTAVMVLQEAVKLARHEQRPREAVEEALRRIAAGSDGIMGTADDLLPAATIDTLIALLNTGLVGDLVDALMRKLPTCSFVSCFGF